MHYLIDMMLLFTLSTLFIIMLAAIVGLCLYHCGCRKAVKERMKGLRIERMLGHLGVDRNRYLRKATPYAVQTHLHVCAHCKTTDQCDERLINGMDIPEETFCRNYPELVQYRSIWGGGLRRACGGDKTGVA